MGVFLGAVILILLAYVLLVRPLTRNGYQRRYDRGPGGDPRDGYGRYRGGYDGFDRDSNRGFGGGGFGTGFGRGGGLGMMAGGFAAGALLTWLLEQGRINSMQYDYFQGMDQQRMIDELMNQNILQQHEIDDLMNREALGNDEYMNDQYARDDSDRDFGRNDGFDSDYNDDGFNGSDNDDNWV